MWKRNDSSTIDGSSDKEARFSRRQRTADWHLDISTPFKKAPSSHSAAREPKLQASMLPQVPKLGTLATRRKPMSKTPIKLTEEERTTIVNALTVAARQYQIDAEHAAELELHGMTIFEPARALAKQFQELATDARQLRDKITFLWEHIQL
jgi:hypothetical protein